MSDKDINNIKNQIELIKKLIQTDKDQDKKIITTLKTQMKSIDTSINDLDNLSRAIKGGSLRKYFKKRKNKKGGAYHMKKNKKGSKK